MRDKRGVSLLHRADVRRVDFQPPLTIFKSHVCQISQNRRHHLYTIILKNNV